MRKQQLEYPAKVKEKKSKYEANHVYNANSRTFIVYALFGPYWPVSRLVALTFISVYY